MAKLLSTISKCQAEELEGEEKGYVGGCGSAIPTKIRLSSQRIIIEEKVELSNDLNPASKQSRKKDVVYPAQKVRNIFSKITNEDAKLLGFTITKPIDLLISTLAVAPPQIRPSIEMNPEKKAED